MGVFQAGWMTHLAVTQSSPVGAGFKPARPHPEPVEGPPAAFPLAALAASLLARFPVKINAEAHNIPNHYPVRRFRMDDHPV